MWSHYAASHRGLVLQFEPTRHLDIFTYPVPVHYERTYPILNWVREHEEAVRVVMMRKHSVWEYEKEFRLVHPGGARSYLPFAPAGLTGITLGCKAPAETEGALQALLDERRQAGHPPVRLLKAHQHQTDYKLVFKRKR